MYLFGVKYCYNLVRLQIACCHLVFGKKSPSFQNVDFFPELDRCTPCVFIGTVARFSRNKSLLTSFGAPVIELIPITVYISVIYSNVTITLFWLLQANIVLIKINLVLLDMF